MAEQENKLPSPEEFRDLEVHRLMDEYEAWIDNNPDKIGSQEDFVMRARIDKAMEAYEPYSAPGSAGMGFVQGATQNLAAPLAGMAQGAGQMIAETDAFGPSPGAAAGNITQSYSQGRDAVRQMMARAEVDNPASFTGGEIVGSAGTSMLPGGRVVSGARGFATPMKLGAAGGAASGSIYGTGEGGSFANIAREATSQGVGGGIFGIGGAALGRGAGKLATRSPSTAPNSDALKAQAGELYKRAHDMGVAVNPQAFRGIVVRMLKEAEDTVLPGQHPELREALKYFGDAARRNEPVSLEQIDKFRRWFQSPAMKFDNPTQQAMAIHLRGMFDQWYDRVGARQLVGVDPASAREAGSLLKEARRVYRAKSKMEIIEDLFEKAQDKGNVHFTDMGEDKNVQQLFNALKWAGRKKSAAWKTFTKKERDAITKIIDGSTSDKMLRRRARSGGTGPMANTLRMGRGAIIGSGAEGLFPGSGGPVGGAAYAADTLTSKAARALMRGRTEANVNTLERIISERGSPELDAALAVERVAGNIVPRAVVGAGGRLTDEEEYLP